MSVTAWIVLGLIAALAVWAVTVYNRLVQLRNRIANAFGQIDVQLKRRYDLIPNLVEVAKGYLAHEAATLEAVIKARGQAQGAAAAVRAEPGSASAMGHPCPDAWRRHLGIVLDGLRAQAVSGPLHC